jgi:hypothetical protein
MSNPKAVALINQDPEIRALMEEVDSLSKQTEERLAFKKKEIDDLREKHIKAIEGKFDLIRDHLLAKGQLPEEWDGAKHVIRADTDLGVVVMVDKDEKPRQHPMMQLIGGFLNPNDL